jgi:hypothetical protein
MDARSETLACESVCVQDWRAKTTALVFPGFAPT